MFQVQSEFILESERESFIEQIREVIENADEKGLERDTNSQVKTTQITSVVLVRVFLYCCRMNCTQNITNERICTFYS